MKKGIKLYKPYKSKYPKENIEQYIDITDELVYEFINKDGIKQKFMDFLGKKCDEKYAQPLN